MASITISLPDDLIALAEARASDCPFEGLEDYIRHLIHVDLNDQNWEMDEATAAALAEGEASGVSGLTFDEILADVRRRYVEERASSESVVKPHIP